MIVRTTVKSIQDIMCQDVGVDGDAQRISQLTWMFFLKIIDDQDQELELTRDGYRSPIPRIWVLTIVDTWSRICPVMRVCRSATAMVVIEALDEARHTFGLPHTIRVDQGCQFTSKELDLWAYTRGITLDFSRLGKPTDNAGGIRPSARRRGRETLSLFEREEIFQRAQHAMFVAFDCSAIGTICIDHQP